ncbi:hypothetical protein RUM43_008901 [Polyplax serrata]|uniref:Uncharacterized protein n=1 Tax=Polyplax serrata TaxID=468196 RepID=A0AAN8P6P6_POLSC
MSKRLGRRKTDVRELLGNVICTIATVTGKVATGDVGSIRRIRQEGLDDETDPLGGCADVSAVKKFQLEFMADTKNRLADWESKKSVKSRPRTLYSYRFYRLMNALQRRSSSLEQGSQPVGHLTENFQEFRSYSEQNGVHNEK